MIGWWRRLPAPVRLIGQEILVVGAALGCVLLSRPSGFAWSEPAAIVACLALPLRLRWPWLAMLFCLWGLTGELGLSPALVGLYRIGRTARSPWIPVAWAAAAVVAPQATVLATEDLALRDAILSVLFSVLWTISPTALGMLVTTRQRLTASLAELRLAREAELAARAQQARVAERARIGREIHDAVGHHATLIAVEAAALVATTGEPETRAAGGRMRELAKASLAEMRAALGLVNTAGAQDAAQGMDRVAELIDRARSAGQHIEFTGAVPVELAPAVSRAGYRIIQEALTNAAKHAPGAAVGVAVVGESGDLALTITSTPVAGVIPTQPDSGGQGLTGMAERARTAGGKLDVERGAGGKFTIRAQMPLHGYDPPKVDPVEPTNDGSQAAVEV